MAHVELVLGLLVKKWLRVVHARPTRSSMTRSGWDLMEGRSGDALASQDQHGNNLLGGFKPW